MARTIRTEPKVSSREQTPGVSSQSGQVALSHLLTFQLLPAPSASWLEQLSKPIPFSFFMVTMEALVVQLIQIIFTPIKKIEIFLACER